MKQTAPSARRFVTLRACANNVMRKLEVFSLLARRFVTLRASGNTVMRKLEVYSLLARRFVTLRASGNTVMRKLEGMVCWLGGSSRFAWRFLGEETRF